MVAVLREDHLAYAQASNHPVVVVGTGPAGVRAVQELTRRMPHQNVVWCGAESCEPYNRVHLSSLLSGELGIDRFGSDYSISPEAWLDRRFGCEITRIDREARQIIDARNRTQRYSRLVLATGSTPRIPDIPNISLPGVYTFRNFADAQALFARLMRSRRTVVIGGGLLGLEAAKAMHRFNTEVTVLEHATRLMARQLDETGALVLKQHIEALGIVVRLGVDIHGVIGDEHVTGIQLSNEEVIDCDTIVVAAGIKPNVDLAQHAGLSVGRGIHIDDATRTSDPNIHAIGECAEHRGVVYGLAAPGIEQATIAAGVIAGETTTYDGTVSATRLKVVGMPVFSIGEVLDEDLAGNTHAWNYRSEDRKTYARLVTRNGRSVGAAAVGEVADINRLQDAVTQHRVLWFWELWSFLRTGKVWSKRQSVDVTQWPATTTVCNCMGVTRGRLSDAVSAGCTSVEALASKTGASTVCGSCRPLLAQLAGTQTIAPATTAKPLLWIACIAILFTTLCMLPWSIPYPRSVQSLRYDILWRDFYWKEFSGYTLLGVIAFTLLLAVRKRIVGIRWGEFGWWRIVHAALGLLTLTIFVVHTGGRLGSKSNLALALCFLGAAAVGGYASTLIAREHRLGTNGVALRRNYVWLHVLMSWPLPALLIFHVLKSYYF